MKKKNLDVINEQLSPDFYYTHYNIATRLLIRIETFNVAQPLMLLKRHLFIG